MENLTLYNQNFFDYVNSDDPAEIDRGIRDTIRGVHLSNLNMGLALARIKSERIFKKLKYKSMHAYLSALTKDTKSDISSLYGWLNLGEVYIKRRNDLENIGFNEDSGPSKLAFLERALALGPKDEVYENLINMPVNEFASYARSLDTRTLEDQPFFEVRGNAAYIRGEQVITVSKKLGKEDSEMIMEAFQVVCRALDRGGHVVAVHLRNKKEAELFKTQAKRIRRKLQREKVSTHDSVQESW